MDCAKALTYSELRHYLVKAKRNGTWWRALSKIERSFYEACTIFSKTKAIASQKLVSMLSEILEKLKPPKLRAIEIGKRKAEELISRFKVTGLISLAPWLEDWLKDENALEYLGFIEMSSRGCYG